MIPAHVGSPRQRAVKWVCVCDRTALVSLTHRPERNGTSRRPSYTTRSLTTHAPSASRIYWLQRNWDGQCSVSSQHNTHSAAWLFAVRELHRVQFGSVQLVSCEQTQAFSRAGPATCPTTSAPWLILSRSENCRNHTILVKLLTFVDFCVFLGVLAFGRLL